MKFFSKKNSNKGGFVKLDQPTTGNDANVKPSKKALLALHTGRSLRLSERRQQPSPSIVDEVPTRGREVIGGKLLDINTSFFSQSNADSAETATTTSMASGAASKEEDMAVRPVLITVAPSQSPQTQYISPASVRPEYSRDILSQLDDEEPEFGHSHLFAFDSDETSLVDHDSTFEDYTFSGSTTGGSTTGASTMGTSTANSSFYGESTFSISVLEHGSTLGTSASDSTMDASSNDESDDKAGWLPSGTPKVFKEIATGMSIILEDMVYCGRSVASAAETAVVGPPGRKKSKSRSPSSSRRSPRKSPRS